MQENITSRLATTATAFTGALQSVPQDAFDTIPFEDSWTAGQVGEHILRSVGNLSALLNGRTSPPGRPADAHVAQLEAIFLDFSSRMKSPDFVAPVEAQHPKEPLISALTQAFTDVVRDAGTLDLSLLCLDTELPRMGRLTRQEWVTFALVHTQRHLHQLHGIITALPAAAPSVR